MSESRGSSSRPAAPLPPPAPMPPSAPLPPPAPMPIDEKLQRVAFHAAPEPHITLDEAICGACPIERVCVTVCPADNYRHDEATGRMILATESCLECGACRIVCTAGAVTWAWPRGGHGVCYLQG